MTVRAFNNRTSAWRDGGPEGTCKHLGNYRMHRGAEHDPINQILGGNQTTRCVSAAGTSAYWNLDVLPCRATEENWFQVLRLPVGYWETRNTPLCAPGQTVRPVLSCPAPPLQGDDSRGHGPWGPGEYMALGYPEGYPPSASCWGATEIWGAVPTLGGSCSLVNCHTQADFRDSNYWPDLAWHFLPVIHFLLPAGRTTHWLQSTANH